MPIDCPVKFTSLEHEEFKRLDYRVMEQAFASHNDLGRHCDETIYQNDLQARLEAAGLGPVRTEVPVTVTFRDFSKTYYLDLVVHDAVVYELKTVALLTGEYKAQLLNYLLLLDLPAGKLINFRTPSVEYEFVNTRLTPEERRAFTTDTTRWHKLSPACAALRETLLELLREWGAFLDLTLYQEALTWFLGGEDQVMQRLEIHRDGRVLGTQRVPVHARGIAFRLTAHTENLDRAESHLSRFLRHTNLDSLQWLNLNRTDIHFVTLRNNLSDPIFLTTCRSQKNGVKKIENTMSAFILKSL
ncbi:MAG: GxxExxY protein [Verrucomicrobiota bacterium]